MKKIFSIMLISVAAVVCAVSCKDPVEPTPDFGEEIVGEWQLKSIATKTTTLGGQAVDVYIAFEKGGSFTLYQMLGQGRYHSYTGKWALADGILTGTYSSGKAWGSTYTVDITDSTLTLTSNVGGEVDTYAKTTIPENVKKEAYAQ
ncbi:MAG: lipocalin family protein [Bacteroidales bacterium]|nr:lipocalin family protein [Bacteroidales bacterium]